MKRTSLTLGMLLALFAANAVADDKADLIALDKQWGEATGKADKAAAAKFVADNVVSVDGNGIKNKQQMMNDMPTPSGQKYEGTDYKVTFINPDTAIMTHSTKGADAHHSLHVWSRKGGTWQIIATSLTPAARE